MNNIAIQLFSQKLHVIRGVINRENMLIHFENTPMQYKEIFQVINEKVSRNLLIFFLFLLKTVIVGTR